MASFDLSSFLPSTSNVDFSNVFKTGQAVDTGFKLGDIFNFPATTPPFVSSPVTITPAPGGGFLSNIDQTISQIGNSVANVFNTQAQIIDAQNKAKIAEAAGKNAVATAHAGLPSPQLMLLGGFGLVALLILSGGKRK